MSTYDFVYEAPTVLTLSTPDADKDLKNMLTESSLDVTFGASQGLVSLLEACNFVRRGRTSWAISTNENGVYIERFFREYVKRFTPQTLQNADSGTRLADYSIAHPQNRVHYPDNPAHDGLTTRWGGFHRALEAIPDFDMPNFRVNTSFISDYCESKRRRHETPGARMEMSTLGIVMMNIKNDLLWIRVYPTAELVQLSHMVSMVKTRGLDVKTAKSVAPYAVHGIAKKLGLPIERVFDSQSEALLPLVQKAQEVISVGYATNRPASVVLFKGEDVKLKSTRTKLGKMEAGKEQTLPMRDVLAMQKRHAEEVEFFVHPSMDDIARMEQAQPYDGDARLRDYQKTAVGLHLATTIGYLQTCSPGMGKTVMQLVGMKARSESIQNYRGLIVTEANVLNQWEEEAEKWFPEADLHVIRSSDGVAELTEALAQTKPVIVLLSYTRTLLAYEEEEARVEFEAKLNSLTFKKKMELLQSRGVPELHTGSVILDSHWHDISADEAVVIRNANSKASKVLWTLRKNSDVATALTATPINKSPDDIARLISWVRNDRNMFTGTSLSEQFDVETAKGAKLLADTFGPLVFRRDTSEIAEELPEVTQSVRLLQPSASEKALANAAENELKRCYLELVTALDELEKLGNNVDKDQLKEAKEQLRAANGQWVGGTQLARMATSDPSALMSSESTGAALLQAQGLVQAAMADEPTKRKEFFDDVQKYLEKGQQVIVFTEFEVVARKLVDALQSNGINAKAYTGKNGGVRDRARKEFQDGQLDVLVATRAGERGLTLHKASAIYHYDLPWTLEAVIQRTGRGVRIGSDNKQFDIIFLVMEGTVEHRMADNLVSVGMSASLILDKSRGVDIKNTETGTAMGGLVGAMSKRSDNKNIREFGKMLLGV